MILAELKVVSVKHECGLKLTNHLTVLDFVMPRRWTENESRQFWTNRPWILIGRDDRVANRREELRINNDQREERDRLERQSFLRESATMVQHPNAE